MRAATVVQVLQDFEAPPTIAPRPPNTVANPHIDRCLGSKQTHIQSHDLVGRLIDHRLMSRGERENARKKTRSLWTAAYPHEPFDVDLSSAANDCNEPSEYTRQSSYDLEAAVGRQSKFYYQVWALNRHQRAT